MATESRAEENHGSEPRVKTYPLNSRRLTSGIIGRIAAALGLPKATQADSQQMIEGTLSESREPWSVQVDLVEADGATTVRLRDAEGVFLEVPLTCSEEGEEPVSPRAIDGGLSADGSRGGSPRESEAEAEAEVATAVAALDAVRTRVSDLESRLEEADRRNSDLEEEVRELKEKLRGEGEKYSVLWRMNCAQLKQYDNMIATKEEELLSMEARMTALEGSTPRGTGASPIEPVPPEGGAAAILSPTSSAHNAPGRFEPGHTGVVRRQRNEYLPLAAGRTSHIPRVL